MKFGLFYELQLPKPWTADSEHRLHKQALEQVVLADRLGIDYAWQVEHHFLEEYSHASAPEVFLGAAAAVTQRIRLGHGVRQVIANYNHPARTAETLATLDLLADGRVDFGFGEGATRLELGGFNVPAKKKRAYSHEAVEQICNMLTMTPYPGYQGESFSMPCRNLVPKPYQKPHPPLWMACTNRDTIIEAARCGVGALAFSFVDPEEARGWVKTYYDTIKSDRCVPIGHAVNANLAMVSEFSVHPDRAEAIRRGLEGFEFFKVTLQQLVTRDTVPGRTVRWKRFIEERGDRTERIMAEAQTGDYQPAGIGTPQDLRQHLRQFEEAGIDQVILLQQAGNNRHEHICEAMELFANEVMGEFHERAAKREARKRAELAPYIDAAMERKVKMPPLGDEEIPVVEPSVTKAGVPNSYVPR